MKLKQRTFMGMIVVTVAVAMLWSGCAPVISKDMLRDVNRDISFADLRKDPKEYIGEMVLLGGVIVKVTYKEDGTFLEVYQTAIDDQKEPVHLDVSEGRFLVRYKGFLESGIYGKGRKVTIVGTVEGVKVLKIGDLDYHYPYLLIKEIHLWEKEQEVYEPYLWYPIGPWGPWGPWGYPYYRYGPW